MFCDKCGSQIKDGAQFCPKCGKKTGKAHMQTGKSAAPGVPSAGWGMGADLSKVNPIQNPMFSMNPAQNQNTSAAKREIPQKAIMYGVIALAAVCFIAVLGIVVGVLLKNGQKHSVTGEWISDESVDMGNVLKEFLIEECDCGEWTAEQLVSLAGINEEGGLAVTFSGSSGKIRLGVDDVSFGLNMFSYDDLGNGRMSLNLDLSSIPVVGVALPASVSYTAKYEVSKDKLVIDFFGTKIHFTRRDNAEE